MQMISLSRIPVLSLFALIFPFQHLCKKHKLFTSVEEKNCQSIIYSKTHQRLAYPCQYCGFNPKHSLLQKMHTSYSNNTENTELSKQLPVLCHLFLKYKSSLSISLRTSALAIYNMLMISCIRQKQKEPL